MERCCICLSNTGNIRRICCCYLHLKCFKRWGKHCLICKFETKYKTKQKYKYIPDDPELTQDEIREQENILRVIQETNIRQQQELDDIPTGIVENITNFFTGT